jgi:hypothetical protein
MTFWDAESWIYTNEQLEIIFRRQNKTRSACMGRGSPEGADYEPREAREVRNCYRPKRSYEVIIFIAINVFRSFAKLLRFISRFSFVNLTHLLALAGFTSRSAKKRKKIEDEIYGLRCAAFN